MLVPIVAFVIAVARDVKDYATLMQIVKEIRLILQKYPNQASQALMSEYHDEIFAGSDDPFEEIEVEIGPDGVRRKLGRLDGLIDGRLDSINGSITRTIKEYDQSMRNIVSILGTCMRRKKMIHFIGAGRSLMVGSLLANRAAHGRAKVSVLGDKVPPPNSRFFDGAVFCISASGKTRSVLEIMSCCQIANEERHLYGLEPITVVGIADRNATRLKPYKAFPELCSPNCFLGMQPPQSATLRLLGDLEEQAMSQLGDSLICAAMLEIGVNPRTTHEDVLVGGATGPWHQNEDG